MMQPNSRPRQYRLANARSARVIQTRRQLDRQVFVMKALLGSALDYIDSLTECAVSGDDVGEAIVMERSLLLSYREQAGWLEEAAGKMLASA